jgi:glutathione S-transferase
MFAESAAATDSAADESAFAAKAGVLHGKFDRLEHRLNGGPYFAGQAFSLVDAVFGPVFRYFDMFDRIGAFAILSEKPKLMAWRQALAERPSVRTAVTSDYPERLWAFLEARNSYLSRLMAGMRVRRRPDA